MDKQIKMFLDQIVKNLSFPFTRDFEFFEITDTDEKEYIIKEYFKDDDIVIKWYRTLYYLSQDRIPISLKITKGDNLLYNERENFWVKHDYDINGNNTLSSYSDGYWMESKYDEDNKEIWWKDTYNNDPVYCNT